MGTDNFVVAGTGQRRAFGPVVRERGYRLRRCRDARADFDSGFSLSRTGNLTDASAVAPAGKST
jgi:hypothetical protein